jgi:hypothetical protein
MNSADDGESPKVKPNGTVHHLKVRHSKSLSIEPASLLAERAAPPARDWVCEGLGIPAGRVTSMIGNGGFGKSTIAHQLALAVATSTPLFGMPVQGGAVLGLYCEDEQPELDRKTRGICAAEGIELGNLDSAYFLSRDGEDNILCSFDRDKIALTDFYWQVDATFASLKPRLGIFDTAADLFAGDFMSTPHVRQFIKVALGGLAQRHGSAILLLAHPSASAMASGDGGGFSTAWNNSVRSRLYLRRPKSDDAEAIADKRVLEVRKANYGPSGGMVPLLYSQGRFILDPEPVSEGAKPVKVVHCDTRLSMDVMDFFKSTAPAGQIVSFRPIFDAVAKNATAAFVGGEINFEAHRKVLQRTLKSLVQASLLVSSNIPRGYRLAPAPEAAQASAP